MAFASSTFLGVNAKPTTGLHIAPAACNNGVRMVAVPEGRSKIWTAFQSSVQKNYVPKNSEERVVQKSPAENALRVGATPYFLEYAKAQLQGFAAGGDARDAILRPQLRKADEYVAACARKQYIMGSMPTGVFSSQCFEGSVKFAAEDARVAALASEYRAKTIPSVASFADLYEARRRAIVLAKGCSYEEGLITKFSGKAAAAVVQGTSELNRACFRYSSPDSLAEKYMADCVAKQSNFRAVSGGLYGVMCCDATTSGAAEAKRVAALSTEYRNGQQSLLQKTQTKFDQAKYARDNYAHGCSYEEELFEKYPATAAAMRPDSARY